MSCHAESSRGDLLDGASARTSFSIRLEALCIFATFAGVRAPTNLVHGNRESLVCLLADGTVRHGARSETLNDLFRRFDFINRNWMFGYFQSHEPAQRAK